MATTPSNAINMSAAGFVYFDGVANFTSSTPTGSGAAPIGALEYFGTGGNSSYMSPDWLLCNGATYSQATYTTLYANIGLITNTQGGGATWATVTSPTSSAITSGCYGGGLYLIAGASGLLYSSSNATTWTAQTSGTTKTIHAICYGGGNYVWCGPTTTASGYSTDAVTWTASFNTDTCFSLAYGASIFLMGGTSGEFFTSTNGASWTDQGAVFSSIATIYSISYGNSVFVATTAFGGIATSTNGIAFTTKTPILGSNFANLFGNTYYTYTNSVYLGVGKGGLILQSADSLTWSNISSGFTGSFYAITYGTAYVAVGGGGAVYSSSNLTTFTSRTSNTSSSLFNVFFGNSLHVACGAGGAIITSTDGTTWTARTSNTSSSINSLAFGNSVFVYVTGSGGAGTSADGTTWTQRTSQTSSNIYAVFYANSLFVYVGANTVGTSTDGVTWTARTPATSSSMYGLAYGNSVWVAVGNGHVQTSTDAITWSLATSPSSGIIYNVVYNSGFILATTNGIYTSTNGATWVNNGGLVTSNTVNCVTYGVGGGFMIGDQGGGIYTSTNGTLWSQQTSPTASPIFGLWYYGGYYVIATAPGTNKFTSTNGVSWKTFSANYTSSTLFGVGQYFMSANASGDIEISTISYNYNSANQFAVPTDAQLGITLESTTQFPRGLYIRAL